MLLAREVDRRVLAGDEQLVTRAVRDPGLGVVRDAAFYGELLGLAPVQLAEFRAGTVKFPSLRIDEGSLIDLFPRTMWRGPAAHNPNHLCFATTTEVLAQLKSRLAARSIAIAKVDDHNFGARGYGRSIYFDDPDGISIEVRDYPPAQAAGS